MDVRREGFKRPQCFFGRHRKPSSGNSCLFLDFGIKKYDQMWPRIVAGSYLLFWVLLHHPCTVVERQVMLIFLPCS